MTTATTQTQVEKSDTSQCPKPLTKVGDTYSTQCATGVNKAHGNGQAH